MLFFLFLDEWLILLIAAVITLTFNPIAELIIPKGVQTKEAKAEMEKASSSCRD